MQAARLEMGSFMVRRVELAKRTALEKDTLYLNAGELRQLLLKDPRLQDVTIELAHPGESTRIVRVLDAIEPRVKVEGPSGCFPGFLGPARTAGRGRTHRLAGVAVVGVGDLPGPTSGILEFNEGFIDMSGPAQPYCTCGDTVNICLRYSVPPGTSNVEFDQAVRLAGIKAADYLARATLGHTPDDLESFSLGPVDPELPRIAYINQVQHQGFLVQTFLYGASMEGFFTPTLIHPNEFLDGAVVSGNYRNLMKACTYLQQNNPVNLELLRRHGKDLNFVGVVIGRGHFDDHALKERQGQYAAKLAGLLGAQAAVLTVEGTGNTNVDYMQTVRALEQEGIKAVPIVHEYGGPDGTDWPLVDAVPEAVSIISQGGVDRQMRVPAMARVIGGEEMYFTTGVLSFQTVRAADSFVADHQSFYCGYWQMGVAGVRACDY